MQAVCESLNTLFTLEQHIFAELEAEEKTNGQKRKVQME